MLKIKYLQEEWLFSESSGAGTMVETALPKTSQSLSLVPKCLGNSQERTFLSLHTLGHGV